MAQLTVPQSSPVTLQDLKDFGACDGPCISIYLPVEVRGGPKKSLPARLKAAAQIAGEKLGEHQVVSTQVRKLIDPIVELAGRIEGEAHGHTLALFRSENQMRYYWLPDVFDETVIAADNFLIRPLLPRILSRREFYILGLDQKNIRLLCCTEESSEELDLGDRVPRNIDEFLNLDGTGSGANPSGSNSGGTGVKQEDQDQYLLQFYKAVSTGISALLKGKEKTPLVLCGVEYQLALYKRVNQWDNTAPEGVRGAPNSLKGGEMHARALECLKHLEEQELEAVLAQHDKQAGEVARAGVNELVRAAHEGRILHLFVAENAQSMGNFDEASHRARTHQVAKPGDEDLINAAALQTILRAGKVHLMPQGRVPGNRPMAAIMRY